MAKRREVSDISELKRPGYEIFIGVLSAISMLNVISTWILKNPSLDEVVFVVNAGISLILLADFFLRFFSAPRRWHYFFVGFGWADLLASLPFAQLKFLRVFRLVRVGRLLWRFGARGIWNGLVRDRAGSTLLALLLSGIFLIEIGSLVMLSIEGSAEGANILSASDAIWYTIVTISTVGYGDLYPVTAAGRVWGVVMIGIGVAIFGALTAYLANLFMAPTAPPASETDDSGPA